jgi:hypothetical protein
MEDLAQLDIINILESLESGYDIIESNLVEEQTDFLCVGDVLVEENVLPDIDLMFTLKDYLETFTKKEE